MRIRRLAACALALAALALPALCAAADAPRTAPQEETVDCSTFGPGDYLSFIKNWDDARHPLLLACLRSPAQWDMLFHPAPVMGGKRNFSPEAAVYEKETLLIVARICTAPAGDEKVFEFEKATATTQTLTLRYRFTPPAKPATYTVKEYLGVRIPRRTYRKIDFVENGQPAGSLFLAKDQWSEPVLRSEGDK